MKYFLYVKTSPKGLKYLGKTTKDPYKYMGSGKIWKRHIKKHNLTKDDIITEILLKTDDEGRLIEEGLIYSDKFNVVESDEWANLRSENGDGGDTSKFIDYVCPRECPATSRDSFARRLLPLTSGSSASIS